MGKRVIRLLGACLISCLLAMNIQAEESPDGQASSIEQIYLNMPEITVYGYGLSGVNQQYEAYLGDERLPFVSNAPFSQSGEGIGYYILLDISNSMPKSYFSKLKEGIARFGQSLSDADQATLITFGESVEVRADLKKDPAELGALLDTIKNKDKKTLLFEAVSQAADLADQRVSDGLRRRVIVVISDGEDVAVGKKMAQEAQADLKEKAIPAYALCIQDTARANINSFGEFARLTGGDILVFPAAQAQGVLDSLREKLMTADVIQYHAASNRITNQYQQFTLHLPDRRQPLTREVLSSRFIPDEVVPEILEATQVKGRQLKITFSKVVKGDETASNYSLKKGDLVIPIGGVARLEEEANTVVITAAESFPKGDYTLGCINITDLSQEANPVTNAVSLTLTASDPGQVDGRMVAVVAVLALLIAALVFMVVLITYRKIKKNRGVVFVEGKAVMASDIDVKQHVAIAPANKMPFELLVTVAGKNPKKMELFIDRSMVVGRSDICDLYFDDKRMSRQHFALEWDAGDFYILDLNTTNGTSLNGVKIKGRRKLAKGDQIDAGSEQLVIRW